MKKVKQLLCLLLVTVMALSFAACGDSSEPASTGGGAASTGGGDASTPATGGGEVEEVFLFSSVGAYQKQLEEEVQAWNEGEGAEKGVRIVMETNIDNYSTALQTMVEAGSSPDLFDCYAYPDYISAGWIRNLYDIPEVADLIERFEPYLMQGTNLRGDFLAALPLEVVPLKMVYNKEIFEECGLEGPPETWDQLVEYAATITEKGNDEYYGFGFTTMWTGGFRRLCLKANIGNTGSSWFNNTTGEYDFGPFETVINAIAKMYQDGSMFPTPMDQHIDPIRNRFAEGRVGMEVAPAYDVSVYNIQFPCDFEWGVFDVPAYTADGKAYKDIMLNRANISISSTVSEERMPAVVEAFKFMHSKELYQRLYANSAIIPHEAELMDVPMENELKNWDVMSDTTNYTYETPYPDSLLTLEGDTFLVTFEAIMLGNTTWDAEIDALNERYNAAYKQAVEDGKIDESIYVFEYNNPRD